MSADFEQVMAQCSRGCFTGLLRVRTREGNGEVRFLSGIQDGIRFDSMEGDAALERLLSASDPEFEAISSLPPIDFASTEPVPPEGGLERYHAAQLMRYCEANSLTCALELEVGGRVLTARYRLGELLSVEPDSEHTARLAEAKEGLYRFKLPRFELPANVQQRRSVPAAARAAAGPAKAAPPAAAKPAPAPVAARPAPPPVAPKPAPAPVATRPAAAAKPTPASLAETPIVAMKPVAIVTPAAAPAAAKPAPSFAKAPASPPAGSQAGVPAAPKVAAAGAARPGEARPGPAPARSPAASVPPLGSAATARRDGPRLGPSAITPQPGRPAPQAGAASHPPPAAAHASASLPPSRPPAPRSPVPATPPSVAPPAPAPQQAKPALQGLWADAVKPPPQSAPIELDGSIRTATATGANKPVGRAEGLSSLAYTPPQGPAAASPRARSSAGYWLVAVALLIAVAAVGWFTFGP